MKKKLLMLLALALAAAVIIPAAGSVKANAAIEDGWYKDEGNWYYYQDGQKVHGWQQIDGKWYYFSKYSGYMYRGSAEIRSDNNGKYYRYAFSNSGELITNGWGSYSSYNNAGESYQTTWYYASASGVLYADEWKKIDGEWYYFEGNGAMVTGSQRFSEEKADGTYEYYTYVFSKSGVWQHNAGWAASTYVSPYGYESTDWYYLDASGKAIEDQWKKIGSDWYYFTATGRMLKSGTYSFSDYDDDDNYIPVDVDYDGDGEVDWTTSDYYYLFSDSGAWVKGAGWHKTTSQDTYTGEETTYWYYLNSNNQCSRYWNQIGGKWYYMGYTGQMYADTTASIYDMKNDIYVDYVFNANGTLAHNSGWGYTSYLSRDDSGNIVEKYTWYYVENGELVRDSWKKIGSTWYYFGYNGRMYNDGVYSIDEYDDNGDYIDSDYYAFSESGAWVRSGWFQDESWYRDSDNEWVENSTWYYVENGVVVTDSWKKIGGTWYYFGSYGYMYTDTAVYEYEEIEHTYSDGSSWTENVIKNVYVVDENGAMVTGGWYETSYGDWYLVENGKAVREAWRKSGSTWYYFGSYGAMYTDSTVYDYEEIEHTYSDGSSWTEEVIKNVYVVDENGAMVTSGWYSMVSWDTWNQGTSNNPVKVTTWYYVENGKAVRDTWKKINGSWYYFADDGRMSAGTTVCEYEEYTDDYGYPWTRLTHVYAVDTNGVLVQSGWFSTKEYYHYYEDADGNYSYHETAKVITNWYYVQNGEVITNQAMTIGGHLYVFGRTGEMATSNTSIYDEDAHTLTYYSVDANGYATEITYDEFWNN